MSRNKTKKVYNGEIWWVKQTEVLTHVAHSNGWPGRFYVGSTRRGRRGWGVVPTRAIRPSQTDRSIPECSESRPPRRPVHNTDWYHISSPYQSLNCPHPCHHWGPLMSANHSGGKWLESREYSARWADSAGLSLTRQRDSSSHWPEGSGSHCPECSGLAGHTGQKAAGQ